MGEGIHSTAPQAAPKKGNPRLLIGGSVAAIIVAGILFQFFRPMLSEATEKQPAAGKANIPVETTDRSLARITLPEVKPAVISWEEVANECMLRHGEEMLDNIINRKIIELACERADVHISEAEVNQEIHRIAQKFKMQEDQWYQMLKAERNITPAQYRRDIIWPMLALRKLAGQNIKVSKSELDRAFVRNYGERVKARVIVLPNQRLAGQCWEALNTTPPADQGEKFSELVRKYSMDQGSKPLDGQVPPIRRYSGTPGSERLEEEAFKLKNNQISPVVQVGEQFVIVRCEGRTEPVVLNQEDVQTELLEEIRSEKEQKAVASVFEKIKNETRVDNYLLSRTTNARTAPQTNIKPAAAEGQTQTRGRVTPTSGQKAPKNRQPR
jgi:foldase protein PrsA